MNVNPKQRRRHSAEFKAQVLSACAEPGASVAAVALSFQLNDNLVHQWRRGRGASPVPPATSTTIAESAPQFIALSLPPLPSPSAPAPAPAVAAVAAEEIRLEFKRAAIVMSLVQSAKLNGHDPWEYLRDVLERLPSHPNSRIDELLPHRWKKSDA